MYVTLGIQHAVQIRNVILSFMVYLAVLYFSTLSHKPRDFRKRTLLKIKCVY